MSLLDDYRDQINYLEAERDQYKANYDRLQMSYEELLSLLATERDRFGKRETELMVVRDALIDDLATANISSYEEIKQLKAELEKSRSEHLKCHKDFNELNSRAGRLEKALRGCLISSTYNCVMCMCEDCESARITGRKTLASLKEMK